MAQQLTAKGRTVELLIALDGAPANTHSGSSLWNPMYYWKLVCNFPHWVADDLLMEFSFPALMHRVHNKMIIVAHSIAGGLHDRRERGQGVHSFMDLSDYSPSHIAFMNALYNALYTYVPKPYVGRVLVYKSRTQPLYHLLEVEHAWQALASQVGVVVVRGTHISIVREPYVRAIAEDLRHRLSTLQNRDMEVQASMCDSRLHPAGQSLNG
jgi:thioesterase domain-containing protein